MQTPSHFGPPTDISIVDLLEFEGTINRPHMNQFSIMEARINDKIHQTKDKMHEIHYRANTDSLQTEIETWNWVLNEILVLSREP